MFSNMGQNLAEAMREAATVPQPSTKEGRQAFQRIQEPITAAADCIPALVMCLSPAVACPKTQGLNHCVDLTDAHTVIPNAIEVLPRDQAIMAAANEFVGEGMVVVGILPMGEITKMTGLMTTWGATTTPTMRVTPIAT